MVKIVTSDFYINENKLKQFISILVPEAENDDINIRVIQEGEFIELEFSNKKNSVTTKYKNLQDKINNQKAIMGKTGLLKLYNKSYKWGSLIGVRPTKVVRNMLSSGFNHEEIKDTLLNMYFVSEEKADLLIKIVDTELKYMNNKAISIYIGIPYCPTKCHYCSFASYEKIGKYSDFYNKFNEKLLQEIEIISDFTNNNSLEIESIYIGGGTPTVLNEIELDRLLSKVNTSFDLKNIKEFTLEAGRCETITKEKLKIAKSYGVDRISINPQTFNEDTLKRVNRYYDQEQFQLVYDEAKKLNLCINMDFIIGLPGESTEDILSTISHMENFDPENITIHMLAIKKAAKLAKKEHENLEIDYHLIEEKLQQALKKKEMHPYYMYRQKNSLEWGENAGYAKSGYESIFNINMIEESQVTIALGGGAITKLIGPGKIERIINPKDPIAYIKEFDDRMNQKLEKLTSFLFEKE